MLLDRVMLELYLLNPLLSLCQDCKICYNFEKNYIVIGLPNSADPVEISHYASLHLNLHCLRKHTYGRFRSSKG